MVLTQARGQDTMCYHRDVVNISQCGLMTHGEFDFIEVWGLELNSGAHVDPKLSLKSPTSLSSRIGTSEGGAGIGSFMEELLISCDSPSSQA
jgi:hypothetical protein